LNQGLDEAMVGANGVNNFGAEEAGGTAGGANMGNTGGDESAGSVEKKHGIGVASGGVTRNASASGDGTTGSAASVAGGGTQKNIHAHGDGDGRTIRSRRKSNSGPSTTYKDPFCRALLLIYLIFDFCFQITSHKSDIAVIFFLLAWVKFKYFYNSFLFKKNQLIISDKNTDAPIMNVVAPMHFN
jgi:hypothetical protein